MYITMSYLFCLLKGLNISFTMTGYTMHKLLIKIKINSDSRIMIQLN